MTLQNPLQIARVLMPGNNLTGPGKAMADGDLTHNLGREPCVDVFQGDEAAAQAGAEPDLETTGYRYKFHPAVGILKYSGSSRRHASW